MQFTNSFAHPFSYYFKKNILTFDTLTKIKIKIFIVCKTNLISKEDICISYFNNFRVQDSTLIK